MGTCLDLEGTTKITIVQSLAELNKLFPGIFRYVSAVEFCKQGAYFP